MAKQAPTLEECLAALGQDRAAELLAPHVTALQQPGDGRGVAAAKVSPPDNLPYRNVACVGAGTVGASWAAFYASKGLEVSVFDASPDALTRGLAAASAALERLEAAGLLTQAEERAKLLRRADSLEDAVRSADFIQETVFEDYKVKADAWQGIEAAAPLSAVIASSTSGLLISKLASVLQRPGRAVVAHPFNPPHLINLVELVPGPQTEPAVLDSIKNFYHLLGKAPVMLRREVPGHIANRLQGAVWREAISLVHQGIANVTDVDTALHEGPGVRWAILGQHAVFDLGGGDAGYRGFFEAASRRYGPRWRLGVRLPRMRKRHQSLAFRRGTASGAARIWPPGATRGLLKSLG
eukprot:gnl/TRDRNA2_/TRDRNA2_129710_c0_seq2.p1 gnl/TRDRNA2_/TRDRNA2_129710_c0~~gnl/TRDRNA2_/TRDRNA2_129710_c0_seq2.p1  ORF type:complete len:353 (-),score=69.30 gnl/TRDRNA2_/TRDRNA2_129710_c0_seq2:191-1249(-)